MADPRDDLTPEELAELERAGSLSDEIARKWDPERLLKAVSRKAGRGEKLDAATRAKFEERLGVDLGRVRIYTGDFAESMTRAHRAEALTIGNTGMILMSGSPDLSMATTEGHALLAHELTHVAQAERGVYRQASFGDSPALSDDRSEQEAEESAQAERQSSGGQAAQAAEPADSETAGEKKEALHQAVVDRVKELFADAARVRLLRNGQDPYRP